MRFSPDLRTLRNRKTNSLTSHPEMCVSAENTSDTSALHNCERIKEPNNYVSHDMMEAKTKANLEPLNEQKSSLNRSPNPLIQENLAQNSPMVDTRIQQTRARRSPNHKAATSRDFPPGEFAITVSPPDHRWIKSLHKKQNSMLTRVNMTCKSD